MHVRHKPGSHIGEHDAKDAQVMNKQFKPSTNVLEATGTTDDRATRTYSWAGDNINLAAMPAYKQVMAGKSVDLQYQKFYVAIRPVKAWHGSCISCHAGAHIGDTLGAMVYMVARTPSDKPALAISSGTDGGE